MILQAVLSDVPALNRLVNSAYRGETSRQGWTTEADLLDGIRIDEERLAKMIESPNSKILKYVSEQGNLIGCVHLEKQEKQLYLGMLTVSPPLQGKGMGKELLKAAEQEARATACSVIHMTVIEGRSELIDWYVRHGYSLTGERKPFPADDPRFGLPKKKLTFVVMEKQIEPAQ